MLEVNLIDWSLIDWRMNESHKRTDERTPGTDDQRRDGRTRGQTDKIGKHAWMDKNSIRIEKSTSLQLEIT